MIKNKFFRAGIAFLAILTLVTGIGVKNVNATSHQFYVTWVTNDGHNMIEVDFTSIDNGTTLNYQSTILSPGVYSTEQDFRTAVINAIVTWANGDGGYTGITADDVLILKPTLATVATSGLFSDIASKPTTLSGYGITDIKPIQYWHNGATQTSWKHLTFSGTTTSGSAVFYLTDDGTVTGNALCSATPKYMNAAVNDSGNTFGLSYAVTNSNKTLTVTANVRSFSTTTILGIGVLSSSSLAAAPNGTALNVAVDCN